MKTNYLIINIRDKQWWSNDCGWTSKSEATIFSAEERDKLHLPLEGKWVELKKKKDSKK